MHQQQRNGCRGYPRNTRSLADRLRSVAIEFLQRLDREPTHLVIVEVLRQARGLGVLPALHLSTLAGNVALVLGLDFYLLGNSRVTYRGFDDSSVSDLWTPEKVINAGSLLEASAHIRCLEALGLGG